MAGAQLHLEAVRQRASELQQSLNEVLTVLQNTPEQLKWESTLKQFANINLQLMTLRESLRVVLRQAVVHPHMVDHAQLHHVLPLQLSTQLYVDQLASERLLMAEEERKLADMGIQESQWYESTDMQLDDFNRMIEQLTSNGGCLDRQGEGRKSMSQRSSTIVRSLTAMRQGVLPTAPQMSASGSKRVRGAPEAAGGMDPALRQILTGEASGHTQGMSGVR